MKRDDRPTLPYVVAYLVFIMLKMEFFLSLIVLRKYECVYLRILLLNVLGFNVSEIYPMVLSNWAIRDFENLNSEIRYRIELE